MPKKTNANTRDFAVDAAKLALDRNCTDVAVLDLTGKSPATDFFVIATSTSDRQGRSVAQEITEMGRERRYKLFGQAGLEQGKWILLDYVDVVVHIFSEKYREYYDLELMWGDCEVVRVQKTDGKPGD